MKRFLAVLLVLSLCMSFAGCSLFDGFDYMKAMNLYEEGAYDEALVIFLELVDYADSQTMAALCKQKVDYAEAERLFAAEDYRPALELYTSLMLYEDSPVKAVQCQYALGLECMETANYQEAATWFEALGGYEDAKDKLNEAKWMWLYTHIEENGGTITHPVNEAGSQVLSLSCAEEGLRLSYKAEGYLLGMPYLDEMKISFGRTVAEANYTAYCSSEAATTIVEEAAGAIALDSFAPGSAVEMATFRQTITLKFEDSEEPEEPTVTEDASQAVLVKGLFAATQTAVAEHLPALLESTGVDITAQELGLLAIG